jgi:outer membrane biosynthesis protein TonB
MKVGEYNEVLGAVVVDEWGAEEDEPTPPPPQPPQHQKQQQQQQRPQPQHQPLPAPIHAQPLPPPIQAQASKPSVKKEDRSAPETRAESPPKTHNANGFRQNAPTQSQDSRNQVKEKHSYNGKSGHNDHNTSSYKVY